MASGTVAGEAMRRREPALLSNVGARYVGRSKASRLIDHHTKGIPHAGRCSAITHPAALAPTRRNGKPEERAVTDPDPRIDISRRLRTAMGFADTPGSCRDCGGNGVVPSIDADEQVEGQAVWDTCPTCNGHSKGGAA